MKHSARQYASEVYVKLHTMSHLNQMNAGVKSASICGSCFVSSVLGMGIGVTPSQIKLLSFILVNFICLTIRFRRVLTPTSYFEESFAKDGLSYV